MVDLGGHYKVPNKASFAPTTFISQLSFTILKTFYLSGRLHFYLKVSKA